MITGENTAMKDLDIRKSASSLRPPSVPFTRRRLLGGIGAATVLAGAAPRVGWSALGGELGYLGWQGYEDAGVVGDWLESNGVSLNTSYIAGNDDIINKLVTGGVGQFDVCTPFIAYIEPLVRLGVLDPIPVDRLSSYGKLYPQFQADAIGAVSAPAGTTYTVPLIWGAFTLLYLPEQVPSPPTSWLDLLDPKFKGRVIMYDDAYSQIVVWAKALGFGARMSRAELDQVRDSLIELKKNARTIVPGYGEMIDLFARGEGWLATSGWDAVISWAAEAGAEVATTVPAEGTWSWTDTYALVKDAPNRDTAIAFIDHVISAQAQAAAAPILFSGVTNRDAVALLGSDLRGLYPYDDVDAYFDTAPLAELPPLEASGEDVMTLQDWQAAWTQVKQA